MTKNKLVTNLPDFKKICERLKQQGKKIILTQGSWDMLHVGHARYLHEAKKHGDILIVGVDSDDKIRDRKGPGRPVVPQDERLEMLTFLSAVDFVVLKEVNWPHFHLIKAVHPDVLIVIKENYDPEQLKTVAKFCHQVKILPRMATTSTSAKLRKVQIGEAKKIELKLAEAIKHVLAEFNQ